MAAGNVADLPVRPEMIVTVADADAVAALNKTVVVVAFSAALPKISVSVVTALKLAAWAVVMVSK